MPTPGDQVKLLTHDEEIEGTLVPSPKEEIIMLKLPSGYNVGYHKKEVKRLEITKKYKLPEKIDKKVVRRSSLPNIAILHTGGTIASKVDYKTGGVSASFKAEDFLEMFPEMENIANIHTVHVANMMSEDMRFSHYQEIASSIEKEIANKVDGIIIGHGTDTLCMTSSALAFMFENLPIPVLLVGAQKSTDRGSSDAGMNLICAAEFIAKTDFSGVAICMHGSADDNYCNILSPTKTKKLHTSRRDAFQSVNTEPIASVDYDTKNIKFNSDYVKKNHVNGQLIVKDKMEEKVAVVRVYPNWSPIIINALTKDNYKGVILEATGIGQAPTNIEENLENYEAIKKFISSGGVIALTSQCIFGRVHPETYANSRRLKEIGVLFSEDMLTETAHIKLSWLLANYPKEKVEEFLPLNLRGEISERLNFTKKIFEKV